MHTVKTETEILAVEVKAETNESDTQDKTKETTQCKHCGKKYKMPGALKNHEDSCTQKIDQIKNEPVNHEKHYTCKECKQTFKYAKILQKHEIMHKAKYPYWCKLCMLNFATHDEKLLHKTNEHPSKPKKRKCKICQKIFEAEEAYLYHINEIHKGKFDDYHMCSDCGKQFKTKSELTHHNNSKCGTIKQYQCKICCQYLMTAGSLHNHMLRHTGEQGSMCWYCGKTFLTVGQLKVHERTHTQEKAFICDVCGKGFCHRQSLITHSTLHTGVKPYQCENCGHAFSCVGNLIKHRRTHADTCGKTPFTSHRVLNPSTKMKVKINTPESSKLKAVKREKELQDKLAAYKEKLKLGENSNQELVASKIETEETDMKDFVNHPVYPESYPIESFNNEGQMDHCATNNQSADALNGWNYLSEPSNPVNADILKYEPETASSLKVPINNELKHEEYESYCDDSLPQDDYESEDCNEERLTPVPENTHEAAKPKRKRKQQDKIIEKEFHDFLVEKNLLDVHLYNKYKEVQAQCQHCQKPYSKLRQLFRHEKTHETKDKFYKCSCCKLAFETRDECKTHQQDMHADVLTCQDCDKLFANLDSLRSHQNIFHKGLPRKVYVYVCEKCGLQFRQKAFLTHHEMNNCGAGPVYNCHVCGKGFNSVHTRRSHLRIHDPKKRFLCKFCGKNFRWKGQLKVHERSHTGEKPFKCLYCPKAFGYRESLVTHSSLHTGIKPHLCQACGSRFSCIGNLIKHRSTHASTCGVWYSKNQ